MTEFQLSDQQQELEALKDFVPSWQNAKVEPFIHDTPVIPPTWNKIRMGQDLLFPNEGDGDSTTQEGETVTFVVGVQQGGSFVPKLVTVSGTVQDI